MNTAVVQVGPHCIFSLLHREAPGLFTVSMQCVYVGEEPGIAEAELPGIVWVEQLCRPF